MHDQTAIVWFRSDLRLADNPALRRAADSGAAVLPVFLWTPDEESSSAPGAASRWWLHHSLMNLDAALTRHGSKLLLGRGRASDCLLQLCRQTGAHAVYWNRRYEPDAAARDEQVRQQLFRAGIEVLTTSAALLREPWETTTQQGGPYQVFTPFWRRSCELGPSRETVAAPRTIRAPTAWPESTPLDAFGWLPRIRWDTRFLDRWTPGEAGATAALRRFRTDSLPHYARRRDRPDLAGTSSLSPHLHFGEISPVQIWEAVTALHGPPRPDRRRERSGAETFLAEIGWREFAHHVLHHFPHTPERPLRASFERFAWRDDPADLRAWQRGRTGYPIVDAGMRELWSTGWMHNRVRMIVGSFLTKDLLISWRSGAEWFRETLVDADVANNTLGWQWVSGCGADAAPYFRIFNPVSQGRKFDPDGEYVRRWAPELSELPAAVIHQPWEASPAVLEAAGVRLGETYPRPIVDHAVARKRALEALAKAGR